MTAIMKQKKTILISLILTFLFIAIHQQVKAEENNEISYVLVLNSYHQGLHWASEEVNGIVDTLKENGSNLSPLIEYLDWKNYPTEENLDYLRSYYEYKYKNKKIDIIITTDDASLKFALENREKIFSDAPVVFCGVNRQGIDEITQGYDRFTGVIEVIDPTQTIEIALKINPKLKNIYLLHDNTESGTSTGKIVMDKINAMGKKLNIIPCNKMLYDDMIQKLQELNSDSIILLSTYYRDSSNKAKEMEYVIRDVSSKSHVPIYQLYDFGLDNGVLGGAMLSGRRQGEYAAEIANRILNGEKLEDIPMVVPDAIRVAFDYKQMERYQIPIRSLPKGSEIMNKPFSFYSTYRNLVLSVIGAFLLLITFVCVLLLYIRKIRNMKESLSESHAELAHLYEELAASDEEIKQQYQEMLKINERIRLDEEKLTYLAYYDSLTGLPNKLSLYENSEFIFQQSKGNAALIFIDIDNYKYVNDTLGHAYGDRLMKKISNRLISLMERNSSIYHLGGDEFILIQEGIESIRDAEAVASRISEGFLQEFEIQRSSLHISLSFGIVIYPEHGNNLEELLKYADIAMYRAKAAGRKKYVIYDHMMNQVFLERVNIEKHLHNALNKNEFEIYYQPQLDLMTNKVSGIEALLRWKNPTLGNVSPDKFIKIAEDTHYIIPLGTWVLKTACAFLKKLHKEGFEGLTVSVNISVLQLLQVDFTEIVEDTLQEMQLEPECLELEITETILMESFDGIVPALEKLNNRKIRIALDDFGKGYSSLNYIKQLPISTLKIDKSFIDDITDNNCNTITDHIISIGNQMGMSIVAEGVERPEQREYLIRHKCGKIQGFLFSKPLPEEELIRLLKSNQ